MGTVVGRDESPAAKDVQCVGEIVNLRQIRGDQDDPRPVLQKFGEKLVDLDLGADDDLLLVPAGEARCGSIARGRLDLHVADLPVGGGPLGAVIYDEAFRQALVDGQIDVQSDPKVQAEALITPAFGHQRDAPGDRILFPADVDWLTFPENLPSGLGETTKHALHELTAPRTDQTV